MSQNDDIKIRTLPRTNDKPQKPADVKAPPRWIIYVSITGAVMLLLFGYAHVRAGKHATIAKAKTKQGKLDIASVQPRVTDSVTRHLQEAEIQREMMMRAREMENQPFKESIKEAGGDEIAQLPEPAHNFGVKLDTEDSAERVYEDLNERNDNDGEMSPADRINARLANRKWVNEQERRERIEFIGNFIRSAYERGYELEIDENLVVVGVHKIGNKKLNINQVIDRLAKQGL
jgi:hypothetical protein